MSEETDQNSTDENQQEEPAATVTIKTTEDAAAAFERVEEFLESQADEPEAPADPDRLVTEAEAADLADDGGRQQLREYVDEQVLRLAEDGSDAGGDVDYVRPEPATRQQEAQDDFSRKVADMFDGSRDDDADDGDDGEAAA